jgi:two-component system, NarL family, response regulator NreC
MTQAPPKDDKIQVLLVDDHTIVRKGLRALLDAEPNITVIGEAETGREALKQAHELLPDIVLMDISMPDMNGAEATRQIRHRLPSVKVLVLSMHADEEFVFQLLRAGASGYLIKKTATEELILAIKTIFQGHSFLSPAISTTVIDAYVRRAGEMTAEDHYEILTEREREVLQLVAEGHTSREISERLHITTRTVDTHRANLMAKLGIHTVAELTKYAIRRGIIALDE